MTANAIAGKDIGVPIGGTTLYLSFAIELDAVLAFILCTGY